MPQAKAFLKIGTVITMIEQNGKILDIRLGVWEYNIINLDFASKQSSVINQKILFCVPQSKSVAYICGNPHG